MNLLSEGSVPKVIMVKGRKEGGNDSMVLLTFFLLLKFSKKKVLFYQVIGNLIKPIFF